MSILLELKKQIEEVDREVVLLKRAMVDNPGYSSIAANLESAVKMQGRLQAEFLQEASHIGVEVCSYRSFDEEGRPGAGIIWRDSRFSSSRVGCLCVIDGRQAHSRTHFCGGIATNSVRPRLYIHRLNRRCANDSTRQDTIRRNRNGQYDRSRVFHDAIKIAKRTAVLRGHARNSAAHRLVSMGEEKRQQWPRGGH